MKYINPMTKHERQASIERDIANGKINDCRVIEELEIRIQWRDTGQYEDKLIAIVHPTYNDSNSKYHATFTQYQDWTLGTGAYHVCGVINAPELTIGVIDD